MVSRIASHPGAGFPLQNAVMQQHELEGDRGDACQTERGLYSSSDLTLFIRSLL